jgi:hypothetical protein
MIGRTWRDPHPRGWFESSPPERKAIVNAHRELFLECVRECEEAEDGRAEWGKVDMKLEIAPDPSGRLTVFDRTAPKL